MSDPTIRKITVSPSDEDGKVEPVKPSDKPLPAEEEGRAGDTTSTTVLALEAPEKSADTSPAANDAAGMTVPRTVGLTGAVSFIVGTIIGSGIFISPKGVALNTGSVGMTLCSWAICGAVSMLAGLCYAELGCVIKASGADYAYLEAAFGSGASFIFCWCWAILLKPATMALLALAFAEYLLTPMFEDGCGAPPDVVRKILAVAVLMLVLAINIYSIVLSTRIQIIFAAAKLLALIVIIVGGIVMIGQGHTEHLRSGFNNTETNIGKIAVAFYGGMFAYDGWNSANFIAEEIINPERNLPLAIIIAIPLVIFIYVLTNISYFSVMSVKDMVASDAVAITWANQVIPAVSWLIPIFVAMSTFGSANGTLFVNARLLYATGRNGHMPEVLGMVNVESYTLVPSSIVLTVLAIIFTVAGDIGHLINFVSFLQWIFYGLNMLSLIIFRYKAKYRDLPRPFRVPLVIPVFVFLCAAFIVVVPMAVDWRTEFLYALVFIAIGYVLYFPFVFFQLSLPGMKKLTMFFQLYLRIAKTKQAID